MTWLKYIKHNGKGDIHTVGKISVYVVAATVVAVYREQELHCDELHMPKSSTFIASI